MSLSSALVRTSRLYPDRPAVALGKKVVHTYGELAAVAQAIGGRLLEHGLRKGDRVAIFANNSTEYIAALWGIWWAGLVAVPVNAKLHANEFAYIVAHCGARMALLDDEHRVDGADSPALTNLLTLRLETIAEPASTQIGPAAEVSDSDAVWLFYTSGTTGKPKGVTLTNRQLQWMVASFVMSVDPVSPTSVIIHSAPLSHGSGMYHFPYVIFGGLNIVPESKSFDPEECIALARHWKNASIFVAPTMLTRMVAVAKESGVPAAGCFANIIYGGAPMYLSDLKEALETFGPHFVQVYGQGESPMTITALTKDMINDRDHPRHEHRLGSVGVATPVFEVRIFDTENREVPCGTLGEVVIRGDIVMDGYWNDPDATATTIVDGWLRTGDIGVMDADGFLTLLDRSKDMLISGGSNIYPREIEEVLLTHPAVREASVIGRHDDEWGEIPVAYIVADGTVTREELDAWCLAQIARFKRPRDYRFIASLPKNNYGKVLKTHLRQLDKGDIGNEN